MYVIDEAAIGEPHGNTVPVRPLQERPDGISRVLVEGCGIHLRQGQVITVPTTAIRRSR